MTQVCYFAPDIDGCSTVESGNVPRVGDTVTFARDEGEGDAFHYYTVTRVVWMHTDTGKVDDDGMQLIEFNEVAVHLKKEKVER